MRTIIAASIFVLILVTFCSPLAAQTTQPAYLFLVEGKGVPTGTIHVFSVDSSSGALTEVPGSPFNAGLNPDRLVVDPTGRFVYVINDQSEDITGFSVDATTGALTELPSSPFPIGASPVTSAVDPTGRFLYVFAVSGGIGTQQELLYEYTIDSASGVLTAASSSPTTWESQQGNLIVSIAFNSAGNYAYLGQVAGGNLGAPVFVCSVDFSTGILTAIGSVQPATNGEASSMAISTNGSFLYSVDSQLNDGDAFTIDAISGQLTEITGSPFTALPNNPDSLAVHPSGNFLYIANQNQFYQTNYTPSQYEGSISAFAADSGSGALTQIPGSPLAAGINPVSIVVDPTGRFAYSASTMYTSGYTGFTQILGFSIDPSSGSPTPFSAASWTDSAVSNAIQLAVSHGSSTTTNPTPMISSLSPSSSIATDTAFTLQVNGGNFVQGATVYLGGQPRSTTFVNSTQLNASILASDVDNDGTAVVFVFNPLPGGGASTSTEFPVSALVPNISSISPSSIPAGRTPFGLVVVGANFVASSVVNFNGTPLHTTYSNPTFITGDISAAQIVAQGTVNISVTSPTNGVLGGGTSNTVTLTILPPASPLTVSSISPSSATAGGPTFTLIVNGNGFAQGSQVSFHLNNVTTTFVNSTQLTAAIPPAAIAIAGNPYVIVTNPDGSASVALTFTINNPQPGGGSVSPPSLPAGSNALTLTVTGTGFTPSSVVLVGGTSRMTTYIGSTSLQANLLPSDLSQAGTLDITVMNPPPGGGTSSVISFTVTMPVTNPVTSPNGDFKLTASPTSASVKPGKAATFSFTVSPSNGPYPKITLTATMSPTATGATTSFAPSATIPPGTDSQTVMLTIDTTAATATSAPSFPRGDRPVFLLLCLFVMAFALLNVWLRAYPRRVERASLPLLFAVLLVVAVGLVGCGAVGPGPSSSPQLNPTTGTPTGPYAITVTATSGGVSHTTTVSLTVMQ